MKTGIILSTILAVVIAMPAMAQRNSSKKAGAVELSFNYQKQSGAGSNQWAVWIENSEGKDVPAGDYKICFEATLYFNSILLYSGTFSTKDKAGEIKLTSTLIEEDEAHKNMVTEVKAAIK